MVRWSSVARSSLDISLKESMSPTSHVLRTELDLFVVAFVRRNLESFSILSMRRWRFDWLEILLSYRVFFLIVSYFVMYACCAIRMKEFYGIIFVYLCILYFIGYFIGYFLSVIIYLGSNDRIRKIFLNFIYLLHYWIFLLLYARGFIQKFSLF